MSKSNLATTVQRIKIEIMEDVGSGRVPSKVKTFAELHDYLDANEYGGFCEQILFDAMIIEFGGRDEDEGMPQGLLDFMNAAHAQIDVWLANDGIASFPKNESSVLTTTMVDPFKTSHTDGPWVSGAAMSSDLYNIRHISGPDNQPVASIRHDLGMTQEEALANARLINESPEMLKTMILIAQTLSSHPDAAKGNSKVHFAMHKALTSIKNAI